MNDHDLDLLVRSSLEQDAATQPVSSDLHQRSVSYGRRVVLRRRVAGVSITAVVAAAAVVIASVGNGKDTAPTAPPVPTLTSIAAHVASLSGEAQKTSPWWYSRTQQTVGGRTDVYEDWLPRAASDKVVIRVLKNGDPGLDPVSRLGAGSSSSVSQWGELGRLPTDPAALIKLERAQALSELGPGASAASIAAAEFEPFVSFLALGELPPAQRSAALAAVATIPGVRVGGLAQDATGRAGLMVAPPDVGFGAGQSFLVDPATGLLLEETQQSATGVVTRTTFLVSAGVASATSFPPGVVPLAGVAPSSPAPSPAASVRLWGSQPPASFLSAAKTQALRKALFSDQLSLPADIAGAWVVDESAVLPDGTELVIGHYSDVVAPKSSVWFTGLGDQVQEVGLGDAVKGSRAVTEYVVHGPKNQAGAAPWQWVVVVGPVTTTKVETARSATGAWTTVDTMHGIAVTATSAVSAGTSRVRLFGGGASPSFTGHLAVLPVHRYGS